MVSWRGSKHLSPCSQGRVVVRQYYKLARDPARPFRVVTGSKNLVAREPPRGRKGKCYESNREKASANYLLLTRSSQIN